ncbi:LysR family transcriptional regulator [Pseudomonas gingeri]|uniref:LysR family transcriptional regulator n=1 Tax=Pseudomonas gingeri TaxID=117681 RepID=A0A7Y7WHS9_9PSED|nr:LysR family transcriptional regulator [Pseudomonas gingeri]
MIGSLTLDQLRVLVAIADSGSFSAAARRLGRVQSAISQMIRTLEHTQGVTLFDRSAHKPRLTAIGSMMVDQARLVLSSAQRFESLALGARTGWETELPLAIDPLIPTQPLIASLRALRETYMDVPVTFRTEGLGGAERRLREGGATLGVCLLLPSVPDDLMAYPLMDLQLLPVAAPDHPLARLDRPLETADFAAHVQLVLSDPVAQDGPNYGVVSPRLWRFVDNGRRLDFLLAGLGWCKMPKHIVEPMLNDGRLILLDTQDQKVVPSTRLLIYAAHIREKPLGPIGTWLLNDLRQRLFIG